MKSTIKEHLVSVGLTFGASFLVFICFAIQEPSFTFSREALGSLILSGLVTAVRAVAKLIIEFNLVSKTSDN